MHRTILALLASLVLALPAVACLWDSDTLRAEAKGLPGIAEIVLGRIERWPAAVYEERLARVEAELAVDAGKLEAYDGAAVACDRLGRHDEAIAWMERKRAAMEGLGETDARRVEHEYRRLANLGTFYAHRWAGAAAGGADRSDLETARELIGRAIELNPDAHFGREAFQLYTIEWLLASAEGSAAYAGIFRDVTPDGELILWDGRPVDPDEAVRGLAGLIALGNAWESVDVFASLAIALDARRDASLAYLARLRVEELLERGRGSIHPGYARSDAVRSAMEIVGHTSESREEIAAFYPEGRKAADAWRAARESFVLRRLGEKRHPDTDAAFWTGFEEPAAPAMPNGVLGFPSEQVKRSMAPVAMVGGGAVVIGVFVVRSVRRRKSRGG